ncbi:SH3 domain-binding glutamic acid-rich-like protein 3 [Latimeria chalumnae]|uniref:SH3 domain-binding glutamic acid-rich-like protein 3 n=1 Tax=Latimeria chalumnae TaxID=7897 RepID=UPI00313D6496
MALKLYYSSVTSSREIKSKQSQILWILEAKKIKYNLIDIAEDEAMLEEMRSKSGNAEALPPQLFKGDTYLGDYQKFHEATESEELLQFLKMEVIENPPTHPEGEGLKCNLEPITEI